MCLASLAQNKFFLRVDKKERNLHESEDAFFLEQRGENNLLYILVLLLVQ